MTDQLDKFSELISKKKIYSIPLRYLVDLDLVNFLIAFDTRFIFTLEQDINKLFESNAKVNPIPELDAKVIMYKAPFISYPPIKLNENFDVYFNSTLRSKKALQRGIQMTSYQQSFETNVSTQTININFVGTNRQFSFLEVSLVYDKSDQHKTICDSYNIELALSNKKKNC